MSDILLSLPPAMASYSHSPAGNWITDRLRVPGSKQVFIGCDPAGRQLGSGGGSIHLLYAAWHTHGNGQSLEEWLDNGQRLILHAGGQSRRLPAYAVLGKAFIPVPDLPGYNGSRFDQLLCDHQLPAYSQVMAEAGKQAAVLISSGDVWLDFNPQDLPEMTRDIVGIGMRVSPEIARHFGVYFVHRRRDHVRNGEKEIAFFRQKPQPEEIYSLLSDYDFYVDTGMWLLSAAAVRALFAICGWSKKDACFQTVDGFARYLDLYGSIGPVLGEEQKAPTDSEYAKVIEPLTAGVAVLEDAVFRHLGSTRQIFDFLENVRPSGEQAVQAIQACSGSAFSVPPEQPAWLDSNLSGASLRLGGRNLIRGLPQGSHLHHVPEDIGVEVLPVEEMDEFCLRPFHLDDSGRGPANGETTICGHPAGEWLTAHGFKSTSADIYEIAIYPLVKKPEEINQKLLDWFLSMNPDPKISRHLQKSGRFFSARDLPVMVDIPRLFAARDLGLALQVEDLFARAESGSVQRALSQDWTVMAEFAKLRPALLHQIQTHLQSVEAMLYRVEHRTRLYLFLDRLGLSSKKKNWRESGFQLLRESIVDGIALQPVRPQIQVKDDQIIWARSPVRLDIAGGWSDTPPYCLEYGGAVLNMAVMLNGQPPIQVFARITPERHIRLRSIDLGVEEIIQSYEELDEYRNPRSSFSLPKAALALAGFHPRFFAGTAPSSLTAQLDELGCGIELSLLSAVPKGSGLGTSSILAATLLAALGRLGGLQWDTLSIYQRVIAMEQLMTTGGGWQDQAGALFRGIKLIQTQPGPTQEPVVRYVPEHLFSVPPSESRYLLYYTGITRLAKSILQDIVTGMFLGDRDTRNVVDLIRWNAGKTFQALQTGDEAAFIRTVARSWRLNNLLDRETSTDEINAILATCGDDLAAGKLLGAGGGGYLFLCAHSPDAARRIREKLTRTPPNPRARFVEFEVAKHGLQVTVS